MATRANLMQHLSGLRTDELLTFLDDDALFALAAKFFERRPDNIDAIDSLNVANRDTSKVYPSTGDTANNSQVQEVVNEAPSPRPKRPLNAFMAFRTYYLKIFPNVQQKTASGFLTTLWSKEPCRNKWALIAKVYSFARDEVGKGNISLACFLSLCCPIMKITDPSIYLNTLGWMIQEDEAGSQKLVQDPSIDSDNFQSEVAPTTEIELLQAILDTGYLSQQGRILMARLSANSGMMTTSQLPVETPQLITQQKIDYCHLVSTNPIQAAKDLLGPHYNEDVLRALGIRTIQIDDMDSIPYGMLQAPQPDPIQFYNYSEVNMEFAQNRALQFEGVQSADPIDIDSPYDIDATIGYRQAEGDRTIGLLAMPTRISFDIILLPTFFFSFSFVVSRPSGDEILPSWHYFQVEFRETSRIMGIMKSSIEEGTAYHVHTPKKSINLVPNLKCDTIPSKGKNPHVSRVVLFGQLCFIHLFPLPTYHVHSVRINLTMPVISVCEETNEGV